MKAEMERTISALKCDNNYLTDWIIIATPSFMHNWSGIVQNNNELKLSNSKILCTLI